MKLPYPRTGATALSSAELVDLYLELRPKLERVIARRTGSPTLAADLAQEMFFKIDGIKVPLLTRADAERYFVKVAINAALDLIKVEARRRAILKEAGPLIAPDPPPSAERAWIARTELRQIQEALDELPEKCRAIFVMSRFQDLPHTYIANALGVSQSLVEKYIARAIRHIRNRVSE